LLDAKQEAGKHSLKISGSASPLGMYWLQVTAENKNQVIPWLLIR